MKFGLFVELPNTVEGLVHISVMNDDYYEYSEKHMALIGRKSHRIFQMGQPIKVKLVRADKDLREVDFEIVNPEEAPKTKIRVPHNDQYHGRGRGRKGRTNNKSQRENNNGSHYRNTQGKWRRSNQENGRQNNRQINRGQTRHHNNSRDHESVRRHH